MARTNTCWRPGLALLALALALVAGATTTPAKAQGVTPDHLAAHGWTCIQPRVDPSTVALRAAGARPAAPSGDGGLRRQSALI